MLREPTVVYTVVKEAIPLVSVATPRVVKPERNVTVPVGIPPYWPFTVAVNVTG
jgi:hypothetical protein